MEGVVRTVRASTEHAAQASKTRKAGRDRLIILSPPTCTSEDSVSCSAWHARRKRAFGKIDSVCDAALKATGQKVALHGLHKEFERDDLGVPGGKQHLQPNFMVALSAVHVLVHHMCNKLARRFLEPLYAAADSTSVCYSLEQTAGTISSNRCFGR